MATNAKPTSHRPNAYYDYVLSHYKNIYHQSVNTYFSKNTISYDSKILKSHLEPKNYYKYQYIVAFHPEKIFVLLPHISHHELYEDETISDYSRDHIDDLGLFFEFDLKTKVLRSNVENIKALSANKFFKIVSSTIKYFSKNAPSDRFLNEYALTKDDVNLMTSLAYLRSLSENDLRDSLTFSDIIYYFDYKYQFKPSGHYIDIYGHELNKHFVVSNESPFSKLFHHSLGAENERNKLNLGNFYLDNVGVLSDKMKSHLENILYDITSSGFYLEPTVFTAPYIFVFAKGRKFEFFHPFKTRFTRDKEKSFNKIVLEAPYLIPNYYTSFEKCATEANAIKNTSILSLADKKYKLETSISDGLSIYRKFGEQLKEEKTMFQTRHIAFKEIINQTIDIFQAEIDRLSKSNSD